MARLLRGTLLCLLCVFSLLFVLVRFRGRQVAAFNRAATNRLTSRFAGRWPGFGIVRHVGRASGRVYRTPVNVFRVPAGFLIALTYGPDSEWVKNVVVAGGCEMETRGVVYELSTPVVGHDSSRRRFPLPVRAGLWLAGAADYLTLSIVPPSAASATPRSFAADR